MSRDPLAALGGERLRFAALMACLAAACELAMGQDAEHALHGCALALRLAEAWGLRGSELRNVYYQALLRFIGCNAETEAMAGVAGDVIELRRAMAPLDDADTKAVIATLARRIHASHADAPAAARLFAVLRGLAQGGRFAHEFFPGHCEVAQRLGRRLGFDERFVTGLGQLYARWDGRGVPAVGGDAVLPAVRVVALAQDVLAHHRQGGWARAAQVARDRRAAQYDPALVDLLLARGEALLADLPPDWDALLALEPGPHDVLEGQALDDAFAVLADYADIQSGWWLRHSTRVAALAEGAARRLGWPAPLQRALRRAALVHDIGRVAVPAHVWARPGPLSALERDRVRLHSQHTAQILARAPGLAGFARLAAAAHERVDGSGYPRALEGASLAPAARLLAAADVVAALGEARPHRPAHDAAAIERIVADEVREARLDGPAAAAVLAEAGLALAAPARAAAALPAGLSAREAEVLGELARGRTNKEIARRLGSSPKTVGHQVEAIYRKAGVRTRAGATLFAMEHGLIDPAA